MQLPDPIGLTLLILLVTIVLLSLEQVPADVTALGVLLLLIMLGLLPAERAFGGTAVDTLVVILGLFVLTAALVATGVVDATGQALLRLTGEDPHRLLVAIMWTSAVLGAFISNTASTAFFIPIVIGLAKRAGVSASKLLMPLAFASILTSSVTLVSTSTNIVVSGLMSRHGEPPMGMFELAPVGVPVAIVGLLYMQVIGRRLTPDRSQATSLIDDLADRPYLTEVVIPKRSPLAGKSLAESELGRDLDLTVLRITGENGRWLRPHGNRRLRAGQVLLVQGPRDAILKLTELGGVDIRPEVEGTAADPQLNASDLAEIILLPRSPLIGQSLRQHRFRDRYLLQVLAVYRHGATMRQQIGHIKLKVGDILLVQGQPANIAALAENKAFSLISAVERPQLNLARAPVAVGAFLVALLGATMGWLPLPASILLGVLMVFIGGCISPEQAYREVDWRALVLIGSMLGLGAAMQETGTADFLAEVIVKLVGGSSPLGLLTAFFGLAVVLTQAMSNQAAAIVVVPVAMQSALQLGLNPRAFAMMIAVAASTSYLTPLEPACLMVYGPGGYRFSDFLKVGAPLTVLIYLVAIVLVPLVWPLAAS